MTSLAELGKRICIIGPSSSGKSTLAVELSRALAIDVVHLDQLYHLPGTQWQPRPKGEFLALHDAAITKESWVMEGNYFSAMPQRFACATAIIWLDPHPLSSLWRWAWRTLQPSDQGSACWPTPRIACRGKWRATFCGNTRRAAAVTRRFWRNNRSPCCISGAWERLIAIANPSFPQDESHADIE